MKKVLSLKRLALAAVSSLLVTGSLAGAGVALAADNDAFLDDPTPGPFSQVREDALANFYKRLQLVVQEQQLRIDLANEIADATDTWIETLKGEGKDTSELESALSTFKAQIAEAQSAHDEGAAIVDAHNGFDDSGSVTDKTAARETISTARQGLRSAHLALRQGTQALREAVRNFRQANKPQKEQQPQ